MKVLRFNPGDAIIKEGTVGNTAYILKSGTVEVHKKTKYHDITLATLNPQEIFGEQGLIEDRPRSASVIAKTAVNAVEIARGDFLSILKDKATFVIPILKVLFERLRQTNELVVQLEEQLSASTLARTEEKPVSVKIKGHTKVTRSILNDQEQIINKFPFKIGRECLQYQSDIFVDNDLYLPDKIPYNVSRNHLSINNIGDRLYILDRGSSIGTIVNEKHIGGHCPILKADLNNDENIVTLGKENSPFIFVITI